MPARSLPLRGLGTARRIGGVDPWTVVGPVRRGRAARRRGTLLAALLLVIAAPLGAQIDIETLRREEPPAGTSGSLGGDLTVRTGNVDFVAIGLSARMSVVGDRVTTLVVGDGGIGFLDRDRFASSGLLHYRRTYRLRPWVSPEWYGQANYDRAQLLLLRALVGAGVRTAVARGPWGALGAGTAVMLEHERLELPDSAAHPPRTTVARSSTFLALRLVPGEQIVITSTSYVQPRFADPGDVRVLESFRLASPIGEALSLTVSFDLRFDARPPDGIARLDTTLRTGVTYTY